MCTGFAMAGDSAYFARRAEEERFAALKAVHPGARNAHLELAMRYADLSLAIRNREWQLGIDLFDENGPAFAKAS